MTGTRCPRRQRLEPYANSHDPQVVAICCGTPARTQNLQRDSRARQRSLAQDKVPPSIRNVRRLRRVTHTGSNGPLPS